MGYRRSAYVNLSITFPGRNTLKDVPGGANATSVTITHEDGGVGGSDPHIRNGITYREVTIIAWYGHQHGRHFGPAVDLSVTPMIPAPTGLTVTLDDPTTGDRTATLSWTAPPLSAPITHYEYSQDGGPWIPIGLVTTHTVPGLENGISYAFKVRAVRAGASDAPNGLASPAVTLRPLADAPGTPGTLNVQRVEDTAILTWSTPSDVDEDFIGYEYSSDGGSTWKLTGSTDPTYTVTGLEPGETYTFLVRAVYVDGRTSRIISPRSNASNSAVLEPQQRIIQECPVGWVRTDRFGGRTRRVLLYEVKLDIDLHNRISIYKPDWIAIYVHPDEGLENLEGWKLEVAVPYNLHREYLLTAENSVVVDANIEGVEGGFAFIANPEEAPFPMIGMGFTGATVPGFDYRLDDDTGRRVDFGIACYKQGGIFQALKDIEDPRVRRKVLLESLDWDAATYVRSEWTVPVISGISYRREAPDTLVEFSDANLARKVRKALGLPTGTGVDILKIPKAELAKLIELDASHGGPDTSDRIIDLTGLEHTTQLRELRLSNNEISDLAPLAEAKSLTTLHLDRNRIRNITPLEGLTELRELRLSNNGIHYLAPLAQAKSLTTLHLDRNRIRDITPLETLTGLTTLDLENNQISDVTPLVQLSQSLEELDLQKNRIQDVPPLASLISLERLYLLHNPIANTFPLNALLDKNPKLIVDIRRYIFTEEDGPTLAVSTRQPLTAGTLNGSVLTLTLSSGAFTNHPFQIKKGLTTSGVNGITFQRTDIKRVSHREITIELTFTGSLYKDSPLTFTVGPEAIGYYNGPVLTAEIPVTVGATAETTPPDAAETTPPDATVSMTPFSVASPVIGEQLELALKITGGKVVAGYQATLRFDSTALRYVSSANGDYLPAGALFVEPKVAGNLIKLNAVSLAGEFSGDGTLATLTFEVITAKASTLTLSDVLLTNSEGEALVPGVENAEITQRKGDVNLDGIVNAQDLTLVVSNLGKTGANAADINGDGVVNIQDIALVAGVLGTSAAAPSLHPQALEMFTAAEVRKWLSAAEHVALTDTISLRGVLFLQQLLTVLTPKETALLPNFPNPFNPETWIPYQLAKASTVRIIIYNAHGIVVRRLELGHQAAGYYTSRDRAAYWDGRNALGEPVASGVYFYQFETDTLSSMRKMVILK